MGKVECREEEKEEEEVEIRATCVRLSAVQTLVSRFVCWLLCNTLQHTATRCKTLYRRKCGIKVCMLRVRMRVCGGRYTRIFQHNATHTHAATHCSTMKHTAAHTLATHTLSVSNTHSLNNAFTHSRIFVYICKYIYIHICIYIYIYI